MSIMDKGRFTEPFEKEKSDKRNRMRIGRNVPAGAANIAYIHTPNITASEGVSFIDTAHTVNNIIPLNERESLAIADEQGYLQYAEVLDKNEFQLKQVEYETYQEKAGVRFNKRAYIEIFNQESSPIKTVEFFMKWDGREGGMPVGFNRYDLWLTGGMFGFNSGNGSCYGIKSNVLRNKWVHVVGVFTSSKETLELYIDGERQHLKDRETGSAFETRTPATDMRISGWTNTTGTYEYEGVLRDIRIWNRRLDSSEFNQILTGKEEGLIGWYPLLEDANDYSSYAVHGVPSEELDFITEEFTRSINSVNNFPSRDLMITNIFNDVHPSLNSAMYYQVSIDYHYDKLSSTSNADGSYSPVLYQGNQIDITDIEGNSLLTQDGLNAKIYVQGIFGYPNAYHVIVLLNKTTTETETVCIKYNHIDEPKNAQDIQTVKEKVQLYVDRKNTVQVNGHTKHMMESGKVRILNPESAFSEKQTHEVINERLVKEPRSIYAIEERKDRKGYQILVPDRTEMDPRKAKHFQYMILAEYRDKQGNLVRHATGLIEDSVLHPDVLLSHERSSYSEAYKAVGLLNGQDILNARDSIESSLPITTPSLPETTVFSIIDTEGTVYYSSATSTVNKIDVESLISDQYGRVKGLNLNTTKWPLAAKPNTALKEIPFNHRYSIIPEYQKTKWGFEYTLDGEGEVHEKLTSRHPWKIRAHIGITLTNEPKTVNINDHNYWEGFGRSTTSTESKDKWNMAGDAIFFNDNLIEMNGFWQRTEESGRDLRTLEDYEFSTEVEIKDEYDDDLISVIFRVKDQNSFYAFVWERDDILLTPSAYNGVGRLFLSKHGMVAYRQNNPALQANRFWAIPEGNSAKHLKAGFGDQHKHIFRVSSSTMPAATGANADVGWTPSRNTRYPNDETGKSFDDITIKDSLYTSDVGKKGWKPNVRYRITVRVTGNNFAVYINDNPSSPYPGEKVLEGYDPQNKYPNGSYGIAVMSQRETYWRNLKLTEYETITVDSDEYETEFKSKRKKLLIQKKVDLLMEPKVNELFGPGKPYAESKFEIIKYEGITSAPIDMDVQVISKNIYGTPTDGIAGETKIVPWTTRDAESPLTIKGVGTVEYLSDGHFRLDFSPKIIPDIQLPEGIKNFKWRQPLITAGQDVAIRRVGKVIHVEANVPQIHQIGRIWHSEDFSILAKDGMKTLNTIPNTEWRKMFDISEDIPASEVLLRIERGHSADGITGINAAHSVNYRFRVSKGGIVRYPVDQFQDQLGMNRIRLKDIIDQKGMIDAEIRLNTVAWTTQRNYQSIPVYAVKVKQSRQLYAKPPRVEEGTQKHLGWYPVIKDGHMVKRMVMPIIRSMSEVPEIYKQYPSLISHASTIDHQQELDFVYGIPEYRRQEFFKKPAILIEAERPRLLTSKSLQVKNQQIVTTRKKGQHYTNRVWVEQSNGIKEIGIKDIDAVKGIFYLLDYVNEEDQVFVTYQYEESFYEYRGFPTNTPMYQPMVKDKEVSFDYETSIKMRGINSFVPEGPRIRAFHPTFGNIMQKYCYEDLDENKMIPFHIHATDDERIERMRIAVNGETVINEILNTNDTIGMTRNIPIVLPEEEVGEMPDSTTANKADIIFVIDSSGSMSPAINNVRNNLIGFKEALIAEGVDAYMGYCDSEMRDKTSHMELVPADQFHLDDAKLNSAGWEALAWRQVFDETNGALSMRHKIRPDANLFFILVTDSFIQSPLSAAQKETLAELKAKMHIVTTTTQFNNANYQEAILLSDGKFFDINSTTFDEELMDMALEIKQAALKYLPDQSYLFSLEVTDSAGYTVRQNLPLQFTDCTYNRGNET